MTTALDTSAVRETGRHVFSRVVAGVDGSPESLEAVRQATLLADAEGELTLVAVWHPSPPVIGAIGAGGIYPPDVVTPRTEAEHALRAAAEQAAAASPRTVLARGLAWQQLLEAGDRRHGTLVAVGSHGQGRARGILTGSTTTELAHKAPCSVLVARPGGETFPRRIVVGVDGSPESAAALAVARQIAERFGAQLWPVVAHGGKGVDETLVAEVVDRHHEDLPDEPVRALVAAGTDADLVVVGSRGLHGPAALGSVSERVAHEARCSVLVVR